MAYYVVAKPSFSQTLVGLFTRVFGFLSIFDPQASRVEELREGSKVAYQRRVAAVKGESLVGISEYR